MADRYGDHFVTESKKLDGKSPLVDVPALRAKVQAAIDAVELGRVGIKRGDLRSGRDTTATAADEGKEVRSRALGAPAGAPSNPSSARRRPIAGITEIGLGLAG